MLSWCDEARGGRERVSADLGAARAFVCGCAHGGRARAWRAREVEPAAMTAGGAEEARDSSAQLVRARRGLRHHVLLACNHRPYRDTRRKGKGPFVSRD